MSLLDAIANEGAQKLTGLVHLAQFFIIIDDNP